MHAAEGAGAGFRAGSAGGRSRRVALVAGGSGAIGSAVAELLAERGVDVVIGYCANEEPARMLAGRLTERCGIEAWAVELDVRDRTGVERAVQSVLERHGRLDLLVYCTGVALDRMLPNLEPEAFTLSLDVNVSGAFRLLQAVLPVMRRQRYGRIVHVTSYAGIQGRAGQSAYAAAKAALIGLTKSAALEEIASGITVNAYAPSVTESPMTGSLSPAARERLLAQIPLGRMQTPREAAAGILWLLSEEAGSVTGQVLIGDSRIYPL